MLHEQPEHRALADLLWEERLLKSLAGIFPVPSPLPVFAGSSSALMEGRLWSCMSFLPGRTPGWDEEYDLAAHGAFLARFHLSTDGVKPGPRPLRIPALTSLSEETDWRLLEEAIGAEGARWYREGLGRLAGELHRVGYGALPTRLIHGDFTTLNVVARGRPPRPEGVIDFAHARAETALTDLGFALWQAGRTRLEGHSLDPGRVARTVAGYHSVSPLPAEAGGLLPVLIAARGFALVARWLARGVTDLGGAVDRLRDVPDRRAQLAEAVAGAVAGTRTTR